mmetsp:Transcript_2062/g.8687  ORF Transcript_2062/g.8687 Transcript_2062/m.8687 type:complete len:218 (+) Transcript_2062:848-1501(+)
MTPTTSKDFHDKFSKACIHIPPRRRPVAVACAPGRPCAPFRRAFSAPASRKLENGWVTVTGKSANHALRRSDGIASSNSLSPTYSTSSSSRTKRSDSSKESSSSSENAAAFVVGAPPASRIARSVGRCAPTSPGTLACSRMISESDHAAPTDDAAAAAVRASSADARPASARAVATVTHAQAAALSRPSPPLFAPAPPAKVVPSPRLAPSSARRSSA